MSESSSSCVIKMGYGGSRVDAAQAIGKSGDEGLDGVIKEDRLGLDIIYVQAKRWAATIGRPEIQKFAGALHGQHATNLNKSQMQCIAVLHRITTHLKLT